MTLEDLLRTATAKGLTHLTLYPVHSEDRKTVYWHALATPSTMHRYVETTALDPVEAITQVLGALPSASRRRAPAAEPNLRGSSGVTAAVIDPMPHSVPDPQLSPENELETWLPKT
jgi:hypothetical protein